MVKKYQVSLFYSQCFSISSLFLTTLVLSSREFSPQFRLWNGFLETPFFLVKKPCFFGSSNFEVIKWGDISEVPVVQVACLHRLP